MKMLRKQQSKLVSTDLVILRLISYVGIQHSPLMNICKHQKVTKHASLTILVHWSFTNYPGSAYLQTSGGGYLFSIPGFKDQEKRTQDDAETWCTRNLSKLLQIENDSLQTSVVTFINNARNQNLMTGNSVITNGQRYSLTWTWVNGIVWSKLILTLLLLI